MTQPVADLFWSRAAAADEACVHALVIGVSQYDHLAGGSGPLTTSPLLGGIGQLSAAATSAARVATWLRDNFTYPEVNLGSVRLLASPSPGEVPLPGGFIPRPATYDEVKNAVYAVAAQARVHPGQHHPALRRRSWDPDHQRGRHPAAPGRGPAGPIRAGFGSRSRLDPARDGGRPERPGRPRPRRCSTTSSTPVACSRRDRAVRGARGGHHLRRAARARPGHVRGAVGQPVR